MFKTPPKTIYRQQQPTRLGPLFQTTSVNGLGHSAYSTLSLVTTHHNFLSYAHCFSLFQLTRVTFDPALLYTAENTREISIPTDKGEGRQEVQKTFHRTTKYCIGLRF